MEGLNELDGLIDGLALALTDTLGLRELDGLSELLGEIDALVDRLWLIEADAETAVVSNSRMIAA